jgi:hypothetical protein
VMSIESCFLLERSGLEVCIVPIVLRPCKGRCFVGRKVHNSWCRNLWWFCVVFSRFPRGTKESDERSQGGRDWNLAS